MTADGADKVVLLVDDDPAWGRLTGEAFTEVAPHVRFEVAVDAAAAMARLAGGPAPDVVLLDLNLPGTDGREILRQIRDCPWGRDLDVVVLSASVAASDREHVAALGADAYLNKPFTFAELCDLVRTVTSGSFGGPGGGVAEVDGNRTRR
jgi:CheY-like chemotaxis protein